MSDYALITSRLDKRAIDDLAPGDAVIVFTPDSACSQGHWHQSLYHCSFTPSFFYFYILFFKYLGTHYPICLYGIERGLHVLVTKPATQLLTHHQDLIEKAKIHNVVVFVEHHKRYTTVSVPYDRNH